MAIKKQNLTAEQDAAANPLDNVWVQANAGTGKTSVLVNRLLRILFRTDDVTQSGILCLTYTNAGAGEMRNRILRALRDWAIASDDELRELLRDVALNKPATDADIAHARDVFFWYIDNPDALKIKTIHGFCEEILHRFPIEAGISPAWTLITDETKNVLLHDTFERLISAPDLEPDKYKRVTDAFSLIVNKVSEYSLGDFIELLSKHYEHFFGVEDIERYRKYFIDTTRNFLGLNIVPNLDVPRAKLERIIDLVETEIKSSKKPAGYLTDIVKITKQYIDKTVDFETYKKLYITDRGTPRANIKKYDFLLDEQERVIAIDQYVINTDVFNNTMALFDLSAAFADMYRDVKRRHNLLDFDDLILYTQKLFMAPGMMGWVLSQLDLSLSHILLDEAQDTSPLHWNILTMLLDDFFVNGDTDKKRRSLFVVGDSKQSIFAFQGADARAFARSFTRISQQMKNNMRVLNHATLSQSFRSLPSILYTVDEFFSDETIAQKTGFQNNRHAYFRADKPGLVEMHGLASRAADDITVADYVNTIADKIAYLIESGERKSRDIMVLVQSRKTLVNPLIVALKKRQVDVAGNDKIFLPSFPAIRDLMNLVRFCLNPADDYSLCCVLKSPIFRLTEADIFNLCKIKNDKNNVDKDAPKITVFNVLADVQPDAYFRLQNFIEMSKYMAPYSFFSSVLDSGVRQEFISALGPQAIDPLEEFMTMCLSYERTQPGTLYHFIKWFITGNAVISRDISGAPGVRIVTAHGSKGLEAPVVFLVDTVRLPRPESVLPILPEIMPTNVAVDVSLPTPWLWVKGGGASEKLEVASDVSANYKLEEYYRLLYVAMTRARDELYIYGWTRDKNPKPESWHTLLWNKLKTLPDVDVDNDTIRIVHGKQSA